MVNYDNLHGAVMQPQCCKGALERFIGLIVFSCFEISSVCGSLFMICN